MAFEDAILFKTLYYGWQVVPDDKTCSDILWKWHIPGEGHNQEPIKFSELQFYKADVTKGDKGCRKKKQLSVELGSILPHLCLPLSCQEAK